MSQGKKQYTAQMQQEQGRAHILTPVRLSDVFRARVYFLGSVNEKTAPMITPVNRPKIRSDVVSHMSHAPTSECARNVNVPSVASPMSGACTKYRRLPAAAVGTSHA